MCFVTRSGWYKCLIRWIIKGCDKYYLDIWDFVYNKCTAGELDISPKKRIISLSIVRLAIPVWQKIEYDDSSLWQKSTPIDVTVYPKKYAHGFVVLCFVVVMQSFIMNSHEVFIHIHQGCFAGTGAIVRLPQCQWSKPDGYGKISQCITTTKHSKAKTVCIFLGIYCILLLLTHLIM